MYRTLLRDSYEKWSEVPDHANLLEHVLDCRFEMLVAVPNFESNVYLALAAEVGYDRALLKLCEAHGIASSPENFSKPGEERRRLEHALSDDGVDLTDLTRRHQR